MIRNEALCSKTIFNKKLSEKTLYIFACLMYIITQKHIYIWREIQQDENCGNVYFFLQFYYRFYYKYCAAKIRRYAKNVFNSRKKNKMKQKRRKESQPFFRTVIYQVMEFLSWEFYLSYSQTFWSQSLFTIKIIEDPRELYLLVFPYQKLNLRN